MKQTGLRGTARSALLLSLTLLGLVAMHGLPHSMASPSTKSSAARQMHGQLPASLTLPLHDTTGMDKPSGARSRRPPVIGVDLTRATSGREQSALHSVAEPMGCAMDHAGCLAVLRDAEHWTDPGSALPTSVTPSAPGPSPHPIPAGGPRAPPGVSLIRLGISRT